MLVLALSSVPSASVPRHDPRFQAAYVRYRRTVWGALAQLGVPEAERDDLAQEVFVVLLRQLGRLADDDGNAGGLRAWIYQTARRVAANHRRSQRRRTRREDAIAALTVGTDEAGRGAIADAAVFFAGFFEGLDDDARATFVLSEIEGRSGPEIAAAQGINVNTAYARVRAVRQRLHAALDDERHAGWLVLLPTVLPRRGSVLGTALAMVTLSAARISVRKLVLGAAALLLLGLPVAWMARGRGPASGVPIAPLASREDVDDHRPDADPEAPATLVRGLGRIAGRVTTIDGSAVAGTNVCIASLRRRAVIEEPRCLFADADGHYAFDDLVADAYGLAAAAPGHTEIVLDLSTKRLRLAPGQRRAGVDLRLREGGARVRGTVVDATGGIVEGALVRAGDTLLTAAFARSDAEGRFELWLDGTDVPELTAHADGYAPGSASLVWPGENDLEIAIAPEARIEGRVVDDATGEPVAGVAVASRAPLGFMQSIDDMPVAISDSSGHFELRALPAGRHHPFVRSGEWHGLAERPVLLAIGEAERDVVVRVHPARRVQGTAVLADGSPCVGARVTARDAIGEELDNTRADRDGVLELGGLPAERIRLSIACDHAPPLDVDVDLTAASVQDEHWQAARGEGVLARGRLVDADGHPIALALIELSRTAAQDDGKDASDSARSDRDGRFEIGPLPAGEYSTFVRADGFATTSTPERVRIADADAELELRTSATATLRVRTVDATGTAVRGVDVMYQADRDRSGGFVTSGSDGVAILEDAPGRFRLRAAAPGEAGQPHGPEAFADAQVVEIGEVSEFVLQVPAKDGVVRGRVVDEDGGPVADTRIRVETAGTRKDWYGGTGRARITTGVADDTGAFTIDGLEAGSYAITASTPGGVAGTPVIAATGDSIVVVLPRTGSLCGTLALEGDAVPRRFEISVRTADDRRVEQQFLASDGAWCVEELARGAATVEASTIAGTATATTTVPDGGTTPGIALRIVARGRARGRIVDAAGLPVRGAYVFLRSSAGGLRSPIDRRRNESGADGMFEVPGPAGAVSLTVLAPGGYESRQVDATLVSGELAEIGDIVLAARD